MKHIHSYYSPNDLYNKIIAGLNDLGKDLDKVTLDDLQPVDEFHIRGAAATKELIEISGFTPDMHILDVGCGVGGSLWQASAFICWIWRARPSMLPPGAARRTSMSREAL